MKRDDNAAPPLPRLAYSVRETCALIGIGHATLYRWVAAGHLRVTRVAGRTLVPAAEISRILGEDRLGALSRPPQGRRSTAMCQS